MQVIRSLVVVLAILLAGQTLATHEEGYAWWACEGIANYWDMTRPFAVHSVWAAAFVHTPDDVRDFTDMALPLVGAPWRVVFESGLPIGPGYMWVLDGQMGDWVIYLQDPQSFIYGFQSSVLCLYRFQPRLRSLSGVPVS